MIDELLRRARTLAAAIQNARARTLARTYATSARRPWSAGYVEFRREFVVAVLGDEHTLDLFRAGSRLPDRYGAGLDERAIELPWVMANLAHTTGRLLDAGSTLNHEFLARSPVVHAHKTTIVTLAPEASAFWREGISYAYEDLRDLPFRDEWFDVVACVSTIEHVGMDNARYAPGAERPLRDTSREWLRGVRELWRVLAPGGVVLITFPFGRREDHGWLQQFDAAMTDELIAAVPASSVTERIYAWSSVGWQVSSRDACAHVQYFDVHALQAAPDGAAAARAVCCLRLAKPAR